MSWPLFIAQTPAVPATPAAPAPPAAPATPAAPVEAPATPAAPVDVPATPAAPTTPAPVEVPLDALATPAQPVTEMTPGQAVPPPLPAGASSMPTSGFSPGHWVVLVLFACVCLGLISTVMFSSSKSDLGGGIMGGGAQAVFRGKKSGEEQLSQVTSWFATAFIIMSLAMTFMFK